MRPDHCLRALGGAALVLLGCGLAGCSDSDDPAPLLPSGESLTRDLIVNGTTDSADPIDVNALDLQFSEDPHAFDDFFQ
jgi:hypothetical protein